MSDTQTTPVPIQRNGLRVPWSALWALIIIAAGLVTTYVYATKAELAEHAKDAAAVAAELKTRTAVTEAAIGHHDKALDRIDRHLEAQTANIETFMRAVDIPERRIKKAKEE